LDKGPWGQAAAGALGSCPAHFRIPDSLEKILSISLILTNIDGLERGGMLTVENGSLGVWNPQIGREPLFGKPSRVDIASSAPPDRSQGQFLGSYHTHATDSGDGVNMTETFLSGGDVKLWRSKNRVMIVRGCKCTLALVKTSAYDKASEESLKEFNQAIEEGPTIDEEALSNQATPEKRQAAFGALLLDKQKAIGAAAAKAGACYYRKCGDKPNAGQQVLDLTGGS
jgi:hypothetical protein